jgi:predicted short-subunit dehydrogenase-like oxidoreductase (DUF2520 family)
VPRRKKIIIIGSGNVAWHLAGKLSSLDEFSIAVYNHRNNAGLKDFEKLHGCDIFSSLKNIPADADYYFICVKDQYISGVSGKIKSVKPGAVLVHTSGSKPLDETGEKFKDRAVMYPLYSFSKEAAVDWKKIPIIIEASNKQTLGRIQSLARMFSRNIHHFGSEDRLKLHLCAVLVNNFPNALYAAADGFLKEERKRNGLDFCLLLPIIRQGTEKIEKISPLKAQTGPAKRKDHTVMKQHLRLLEKNAELKKIYILLSRLISEQQRAFD